jgi:hypothetical protein
VRGRENELKGMLSEIAVLFPRKRKKNNIMITEELERRKELFVFLPNWVIK